MASISCVPRAISWPAIIKLNEDSELIYLEAKEDWLEYICHNLHLMDPKDCLIDSQGWVFAIEKSADMLQMQPNLQQISFSVEQLPSLVVTDKQMTAFMLIPLIRKYAVYLDQCCSAKIVFSTPAQGIEAVALLDEHL